jgi:hypothetical protein
VRHSVLFFIRLRPRGAIFTIRLTTDYTHLLPTQYLFLDNRDLQFCIIEALGAIPLRAFQLDLGTAL